MKVTFYNGLDPSARWPFWGGLKCAIFKHSEYKITDQFGITGMALGCCVRCGSTFELSELDMPPYPSINDVQSITEWMNFKAPINLDEIPKNRKGTGAAALFALFGIIAISLPFIIALAK